MKTIYKYELNLTAKQEVELPKWCTPLSAQLQDGKLQMWALVNLDEPSKTTAQVRIFGTGTDIPDNFYVGSLHNVFLGTVQQDSFVWHVFIIGVFTGQS